MLHELTSDLASFKTLRFHKGMNLLLADRLDAQRAGNTRNRSGKTSFVETVHYLLGAKAPHSSMFRQEPLSAYKFSLTLEIGEEKILVERSGKDNSTFRWRRAIKTPDHGFVDMRAASWVGTQADWTEELGKRFFLLNPPAPDALRRDREPSFRMLYPFFARRENEGGFDSPVRAARRQGVGDDQVALSFLLDLEWRLAREWQDVRDEDSALKALGRLSAAGSELPWAQRADVLRPRLRDIERRNEQRRTSLAQMKVLPELDALRGDVDRINSELNELVEQDRIDESILKDIDATIGLEAPGARKDLVKAYEELRIIFPAGVKKRFDEVEQFHAAVVRNRRRYLLAEQSELARKRAERRGRMEALELSRRSNLEAVRTSSTLDQLLRMQADLSKGEAEAREIAKQIQLAEEIQNQKKVIKQKSEALKERLQQANEDREAIIGKLRGTFEEISGALYGDQKGTLQIRASARGPDVRPEIHGDRSKGIRNMQIFAFDLTLMSRWSEKRAGPGFLIHDSHIFDGVDRDTIDKALAVGEQRCRREGWQYIVTLNTDQLPQTFEDPKRLKSVALPVRLTDSDGLFGIHFDPKSK